MFDFGGCLVCVVVLAPDDDLMCADCRRDGSMQQCGSRAAYIQLTDAGPVDASLEIARMTANLERTRAEFLFWRGLAEWMDRPLEEVARRPGQDMAETARLARIEAACRRDSFYAGLEAKTSVHDRAGDDLIATGRYREGHMPDGERMAVRLNDPAVGEELHHA